MLQGQRLPWRVALQRASRSSKSLSASRPSPSIRPAQYTAYTLCRYSRSYASPPPALLASRSFSTTLRTRKEKDPKSVPEAVEEVKDESTEKEEEKPKQPATKEEAENIKDDVKTPEPIPSPKATSGQAGSLADAIAPSGGDGGGKKRKSSERSSNKPPIPDVYPQVIAIPIARRPLFPGSYKAITIKNREVAEGIIEMVNRGKAYVATFMLKDDTMDKDVIEDLNEIHEVGTFCQITSAFPVMSDTQDFAMTCVLYPHYRIKITDLEPPPSDEEPEKDVSGDPEVKEGGAAQSKGDVVASFEESSTDSDKGEHYNEIKAILQGRRVSIAHIEKLVDESPARSNKTIRALTSEMVSTFKSLGAASKLFRDHVSTFAQTSALNVGDEPLRLADFAGAVAQGEPEELQAVLNEMNTEQRLSKALLVLKKELIASELQSKISNEVEGQINKRQREYFLAEQMKALKREMGIEYDGKEKLIQDFKEKASKLAMPSAVSKVFDEELSKLANLEPSSGEFNVTRNYLDWLAALPWGQRSVENFNLAHAREVLDEDHHGLQDVKDRILEFIAVGKLRGSVEGKIICMVGPPGVGKTSIGKSIARALDRQYYRFSVGGLSDVAEIKGHRRTYVGALPGRIIQALKKTKTENPLILIDEVDKIARRGHNGDPSSALLELLDPEQNNSFLDHYLDIPVDLSKVLFVCTANVTDTIPQPLLDRMEMIQLSGYVANEKMAIAERYLAPVAREKNGLADADVVLQQDAIVELINKYCRESGVRNLKKQIEKVYRKAALKIVTDMGEEGFPETKALTEDGKEAQKESEKDNSDVKETPVDIEKQTTQTPRVGLKVPSDVHVAITKDNLKDFVGPPVFTVDRLYDVTPPGVAMGLAWTSMGGAALYIESILENALSASSHPGLERTGSLKSVMKESTTVAYSFAKGVVAREFPKNRFFEHAKIHLHCPEGAVPKDGPSAGITMATALLSLAFNKEIQPTVAMTGELTVTGKVLRIGGLREKTVAARRAGATMVIFPRDNLSDWLELPENIKEGIEGKPVSWYSEVFDLVFPGLDREAANKVWERELKGKKSDKKKYKKEQKKEEEEEETGDEED